MKQMQIAYTNQEALEKVMFEEHDGKKEAANLIAHDILQFIEKKYGKNRVAIQESIVCGLALAFNMQNNLRLN